ncbi:MAG: selenocysteine-specific translation elongation factor [Oscillospiraceae bacterium]|nr:selenocysteine-specific translation elongation factor [Oscillospiraceae bacterium]MCL2278375.1 selenocysteine-specific translation elongation factor [Oscillospiraceae bacterium]
MKHVIIGTAGHVDHGKTTLVKALTGIDTDRLDEEKRRGVTIEPGFAYLDFDDGTRAGIIDVPGHERFIRNMLAGSGGIDLSMLVIAADEGVMPQTREHLGILTQLGISDGVIVLTKADKAEADWIELVSEDIIELVQGTFLENRPIINVSAQTGEGLAELKEKLSKLKNNLKEKDDTLPFRLPIDRVFSVEGFGIVVTGTLIEGSVKVGETAEILPGGTKATVRNLQVHGENVDTAHAGQRTAISLAGIKKGNTERGDVVAAGGTLGVTSAIDVKISVLSDTKRKIKNGAEVHFFHGARSNLAKVFLYDKREIQKGESAYARLKLYQPLPCKRGDRFVVRFYSPLETLGGGVILDSMPGERIVRSEKALEALKIREAGNTAEIAELAAFQLGGVFGVEVLCRRADLDKKSCSEAIEALTEKGNIIRLLQGRYISAKILEQTGEKCIGLLKEYHVSFPLRVGMNIAELRQKLMPDTDTSDVSALLNILSDSGKITMSGNNVYLTEFEPNYTETQGKIREKLIKELSTAGYEVPSPDELAALFSKNEKREFQQVFESMVSSGEIIMLSPQVYWLQGVYDKGVNLVRKHFEISETLTLAECRDLLGTSRKFTLALLEHLDAKKITKMVGDSRVLVSA